MNILWKLLRQHISPSQLTGFAIANLLGLLIIVLTTQVYTDLRTLQSGDDPLLQHDYLIINKPVTTLSALTGQTPRFSEEEIDELRRQPFIDELAPFTASSFSVTAQLDMPSLGGSFATEMFFEAVPDNFVDVEAEQWRFAPDSAYIPIVLPKSYLDLYNFGFAQSRSMPRLNEGLLAAINLSLRLKGQGRDDSYRGRIVGFSNRLQTILAPQDFLDYANQRYGTATHTQPSRLILRLNNPADQRIASFLQERNYETDTDKLNASKTHYLLRIVATVIIAIGLLISLLAVYTLLLSIYLLVQKNSDKLRDLLLQGYTTAQVACPYQLLTLGLNLLVAVAAVILLMLARSAYLPLLQEAFPQAHFHSPLPAAALALALALLVSLLNALALRRKIHRLWRN